MMRPQEAFKPNNFTATSWDDEPGSSSSSHIRIYFPNRGTIQELKLELTPADPGGWNKGWIRSPPIAFPDVQVSEDGPIDSANSGPGGAIRVFFCDRRGHFRDVAYNPQTATWNLGTLDFHPLTSAPTRQMHAMSWREDGAGEVKWSIWCSYENGATFEVTRKRDGSWSSQDCVQLSGKGGIWGTVRSENGSVVKRLYCKSSAETVDEAIWTSDLAVSETPKIWLRRSLADFPCDARAEHVSFAGVILPSTEATTDLMLMTITSPDPQIRVSTALIPSGDLGSWSWGRPNNVPYAKAKPLSSLHAVRVRPLADNDEVHLFYLSEADGKLVSTIWTRNGGWRSWISLVAVSL